MNEDEETKQEASLELYKAQVSQVSQAIQAAGESPDLIQLRTDLQELIKLTEDSLLELKKAKLLQSVGVPESGGGAAQGAESTIDDEYAAFQAALADDVQSPGPSSRQQQVLSASTSKEKHQDFGDNNDDDNDYYDDEREEEREIGPADVYLSSLIGTKCRAPFSHDWGGLHYGNAMILSADAPSNEDAVADHKVRVVFVNPVHLSLVPCKYFMEGNCRFGDDECRFSHGHPVPVSELQAYVEPDHSKLCEGCRCLAKSSDEVWYPGVVVETCGSDHFLMVKFDSGKEEQAVPVENVIPIEDEDESDSDDEDGDKTNADQKPLTENDGDEEDEEEEIEMPVYLWKPLQTTEKLGAWEAHTKGIGSKLMAKMGYITGQGLGRHGDGRAEPVPILLLPQGKSLDKIMELKEMSGNADLFNAMKKLEKRQKIMEKKQEAQEKRGKQREKLGVFGFLNHRLAAGEKGEYLASRLVTTQGLSQN
ncbi:zinc finger CCCH-type with G patch domain-containing protein [Aplysia californica]|uniref:Zinc finger CCCH-type with G patch domain-containing protein n=1 Tax=Aplysia californica TaxID=6500 RepID=A0ABM1AE49_APLCA|nr:zinc finger CCCH-type with G patch domain-containing protein [Aplysia californica]